MKIKKDQILIFGVVDYNLRLPSYNQIVVKSKIDADMTEIWHEYKKTTEDSKIKNANDFIKYIINNANIFEIVESSEILVNVIHHAENDVVLDADLCLTTRKLNKNIFKNNGFDPASFVHCIR